MAFSIEAGPLLLPTASASMIFDKLLSCNTRISCLEYTTMDWTYTEALPEWRMGALSSQAQ